MITIKTIERTRIVPGAPAIPGLTFRGFAGDTDFPKMVVVLQACKEEDQIERAESAEDIARAYKHLVNSDPYKDMLFAEVDGKVIGYSRTSWQKEMNGPYIYEHFGWVVPQWRRKGIGRTMLHYNQNHLRKISTQHTHNAPPFFGSFAAETEIATTALLLNEGYTTARHFFEMLRPDLLNIPDAPLPSGIEIRSVQPAHYQQICDASREAFRDHWGFSEETHPTVEHWIEDPNFDPGLWRVAWDRDLVAGMVLSFINQKENAEYNRKRIWTEDICVRRPWRRRGLARSLLVRSLHAGKERGMEEAALGVDTNNLSGALRLYESVGFRAIKRHTTYRKELSGG